MLFVEENLKDLKIESGKFVKHTNIYYYHFACEVCGYPFLSTKWNSGRYCSGKCAKSGKNHPLYGKNHPRRGPNHYNWRGGIACEPYCTQWRDKEYKDWIIYERDGRCFGPECNGKHVHKLLPHHINYDKKDCRPSNLIAVCKSCNTKANKDREWHQSWYTEIMRKRKIL